MSDLDRRIERQTAAVAKLARQLQFERLMLQRLRGRAAGCNGGNPDKTPFAPKGSMSEVYAAAVLRQIEAELSPDEAAEPGFKP